MFPRRAWGAVHRMRIRWARRRAAAHGCGHIRHRGRPADRRRGRHYRWLGSAVRPAAATRVRCAELLEKPPNPHGRSGGWDVRPLPPLKRTALGFENQRIEFHHMKFVKNGHLEFWTAIDQYFCWQQDPAEMKIHPRL